MKVWHLPSLLKISREDFYINIQNFRIIIHSNVCGMPCDSEFEKRTRILNYMYNFTIGSTSVLASESLIADPDSCTARAQFPVNMMCLPPTFMQTS